MAAIACKNGVYTFTASGDTVASASNKTVVAVVVASCDTASILTIKRTGDNALLWTSAISVDPTSALFNQSFVVRFDMSGGLTFTTTSSANAIVHIYTGPGA